MSKIVLIDTSQSENQVAYSHEGVVVEFVQTLGNEDVSLALDALIKKHGTPNCIAVNYGPGSYTGLRIGVSLGKGLSYGLGVPMVCVNSLEILCRGAMKNLPSPAAQNAEIWAMVDARRMEVWGCGYDVCGSQLSDIKAFVVDERSFANYPKVLYLCGSGAQKCVEQLTQNGAQVSVVDSGDGLASLAEIAYERYCTGAFADTAYLEPLYAKEWQTAAVPKKA